MDVNLSNCETKKENLDANIHSNSTSSDESEVTDDEEAEIEDVVRFLTGNSSSANGNRKSPKDRTNCSSSSGCYLEVKRVFQNLGLSPTKFLENSPVKHNKGSINVSSTKYYKRPEQPQDALQQSPSRDIPPSKIRLTYGIEFDGGNVKDRLTSPYKRSITKSANSSVKEHTASVKVVTKEQLRYKAREYPSSSTILGTQGSEFESHSNRLKISSTAIAQNQDNPISIIESSKRMDKSSASASSGSSSVSSGQSAAAGEKRSLPASSSTAQEHHTNDNDDETKRKKQKTSSSSSAPITSGSLGVGGGKEDASGGKDSMSSSPTATASSGVTASSAGSGSAKPGRSTRGSSSEKITGNEMSTLFYETNTMINYLAYIDES